MITLGLEGWRPEQRSITLSDFKGLITDAPSTSGVVVNQGSAMTVSAYWCGVMVIAQSIGVLDRFLYRRLEEDDRERATTHPAYKVVHDQPNPYMSPQVFWETLTAHALSWGGGYAEIEFDAGLRPKALWPIMPDKIKPKAETTRDSRGRKISRVVYEYNGQELIDADEIVHIPGLGFDGLCGYSAVQHAARSLGLTIASEEFGSAFFGNGSWTGAVLEHPAKISPEAYERIKAQRAQNRGPMKAHRLEILEEGMKLSRPVTIPPDDAQFLETRQFQIEEIARWLNLPPHKLKHKMGERPGGNLEASQIDYLTDTLLPWTTRIEQELNRKLIPQSQRGTYYFEHLFEKILRADVSTRMTTYKSLFEMGVVTAADIAKRENLPEPEPQADEMPLEEKIEALGQLIRAGFDPAESLTALGLPDIKHLGVLPITVKTEEESQPALQEGEEGPPPDDQRVAAAHRALLMDAAARYMKVEARRAVQASRKGAMEFQRMLRDRLAEDQDALRQALLPALRVIAAHRGKDGAEALAVVLAKRHVELTHEAMLSLPAVGLADNVERLVGGWHRERALELAEAGLNGGWDEA